MMDLVLVDVLRLAKNSGDQIELCVIFIFLVVKSTLGLAGHGQSVCKSKLFRCVSISKCSQCFKTLKKQSIAITEHFAVFQCYSLRIPNGKSI